MLVKNKWGTEMKRMKLLLTRSMLQKDIDYIRSGLDKKIAGKYELIVPRDFSESTLVEEAVDADVLLGPYVTERMVACAKNLKLIQIPWTGMDTFDFSAVQNCQVPVCNTHSNANAVCELGLALTLDLLKKVSFHDRKMRIGNWNREQSPLDLTSRMLSEQTVCILGYGNIGRRMGRLLSAFGSTIIAVDAANVEDEVISEWYSPDAIRKAVSKADIVIATLPLTTATRGLICSDLLNEMKNGVILINLSRAAIMDEKAIYTALVTGKIGGFAADVWWNTPKRGETQSYPSVYRDFTDFPNVVMSPHRAGFIEDSLPHLDGAIENIIHLVLGTDLRCVVDIKKQY